MLIARDTFSTGSAGSSITSRVGELGATWLKQTGNTGDIVLTAAGRIRGNTQDTGSTHYCSGIPASPEYDIEADFVVFTVVLNHYVALMGRLVSSAVTDIFVVYSNNTWILAKEITGTQTDLATTTFTLTPGTTYRVKLQIRAALTKVFVDGAEILSATTPADVAVATAGRAGVSYYADGVAAPTDSTSVHLDNFSTTDLVPETAWLPITSAPIRRVATPAPYLAVTSPARLPGVSTTVLADSGPVVVSRLRRWPAHPSVVAPVRVADVTLTTPVLSWQGAAPVFPARRRATGSAVATVNISFLAAPSGFVNLVNEASAPVGDNHQAEPSIAVPYRPDLLQYQTITGPILPIVAGDGRIFLSMGVPYKLELTQYQTLVGPVYLADITAPGITWAPQLIQTARGQGGWGAAVSSGQSAPGPQ